MSEPVRRQTRSFGGSNRDAVIAQEAMWRSWFPEGVVFESQAVLPDEVVDELVDAFERFCLAIKIKVPGKRVPFVLRDAQRETVRDWIKYRNTVALKARQIGFSTLTAAFALWCALGGADRQIYLLSKKEDASVSLLNKAKYAYKSLPEWTRKRAPALLDKKRQTMTFDNESFIQSSPTGSDPIRGETAWLVVCDEWASFPNEEEAWASIEPTADIGGRVIGLSTAKGEGSFFHRLFVGAQTESNSFHPIFHPWSAVPERDDAWYEDRRRNLEPWQLFQEYPSSPEEAFIGSGNPFFNLDLLREMRVREPVSCWRVERNDNDRPILVSDDHGSFLMYEPPEPRRAYVVGADVAQGLDHGDWSVSYVMTADTGEIVAVYRGKPEPDVFADVLFAVGKRYNYALVAPEVNNHGRSTVDFLRRLGYTRLYRRRTKLKRQDSPTETIGWLTTHGNKVDVLDQLAVWLRDHNVPHAATVAELKTFVREQRGERIKLHGSPHDDCVMALAITVEARKYAVEMGFERISSSAVPGSIDWWKKKLEGADGTRRRARVSF